MSNHDIAVPFTQKECKRIMEIAEARYAYNRRMGAKGTNPVGYKWDVPGCYGEAAVAKVYNYYWDGSPGKRDIEDVGPYHVRAATKPWYRLLLNERDPSDGCFFLVTPLSEDDQSVWVIRGWTWARDGQKPQYWKTENMREPAYLIDQRALQPHWFAPKPSETWMPEWQMHHHWDSLMGAQDKDA